MTDSTLSQALKEAYASAPATIIYSTLELRHPAFTAPIRVVRDYVDLTATLEATAPVNPGQAVLFVAFNFEFTKPEVSDAGVPVFTISMDNVDRSIVANLEAAITTADLVQVTYREYLSTVLTVPANNPPLTMTITNVTADVFKVTATASFLNLSNKRFPTLEFDAATFPSLAD